MSFISALLPSLIVLGLLIIIHEFGHFLACRLTGVKVEKFSIGFGPEIFHWQTKETRYAVSLLPLGGFVKPAGESWSEVEGEGPKPGDYLAAPIAARIFIVCAGVIMNYLLAFVLFASVFMMGRPVPGTVIGGFVKGYPAEAAGLQPGDRIAALGGTEVKTWQSLTSLIEASPEGEVELTIQRKEEAFPVRVTPRVEKAKDVFGKELNVRRLGIMPSPEAVEFERYTLGPSIAAAAETVWNLAGLTHKAIFYMITGRLSMKAVSGPIGIITMTGAAANLGLPYVFQLAASLSVSLAVINLLPIPALDGGHLFFLLIEAVRRKRVSLAFQEKATQVGFALLLTLMVFILYNDLANINAFEKILGLFKR